jgi:hypothetical protein
MQLAPQYRQLDLFRKIRSPFGQKSIILQKQKNKFKQFSSLSSSTPEEKNLIASSEGRRKRNANYGGRHNSRPLFTLEIGSTFSNLLVPNFTFLIPFLVVYSWFDVTIRQHILWHN